MDDFALYGDTYGTLLVDATTRLPLTLWEGRDVEQLRGHPDPAQDPRGLPRYAQHPGPGDEPATGARRVTTSPDHLAKSRAADSERRRSRVLRALDLLAADSEEISVSAVVRATGVHRSLIHRHNDLPAAVLARAAKPLPGATASTQVSRQPLLADVANLTARNSRLSSYIARLERRLSEVLGQAVWEASGLGAAADVETLNRRVTELEQKVLDLRAELAERDDDLAAARAANRELMTQVNRLPPHRLHSHHAWRRH